MDDLTPETEQTTADEQKEVEESNPEADDSTKHTMFNDDETRPPKRNKRIIVMLIAAFIVLAAAAVSLFFILRDTGDSIVFQDVTIELGTTDLAIELFLPEREEPYTERQLERVGFVTDLGEFEFMQTGEFELILSYRGRERLVLLTIEDTTPPTVEFQNIIIEARETIDPYEFIVSKFDYSAMTVTVNYTDNTTPGDHTVVVTVTDTYGNYTAEERTITIIAWVRTHVEIELGDGLEIEELVRRPELAERIPQEAFDAINLMELGEHELAFEHDGFDYSVIISVIDKTPPELELRNVTIFYWQNANMSSFARRVWDLSGDVTLTMSPSNLDTTTIGRRTVIITATDSSGNETVETATITVQEDRRPPTFSGVGTITINNGATVDFRRGVRAVDARTGNTIEFTVDTSAVVLNRAGNTYAVYTATDARGNRTTVRRRITVRRGQADIDRDWDNFYSRHLAGRDVPGLVAEVRRVIRHTSAWGRPNPIDHAMRNMSGNCYVAARVVQRALNQRGISNHLIWTHNRCHYWNLVQIGGAWRHFDATQGRFLVGPMTDAQKLACPGQRGREWDRSRWPAAN